MDTQYLSIGAVFLPGGHSMTVEFPGTNTFKIITFNFTSFNVNCTKISVSNKINTQYFYTSNNIVVNDNQCMLTIPDPQNVFSVQYFPENGEPSDQVYLHFNFSKPAQKLRKQTIFLNGDAAFLISMRLINLNCFETQKFIVRLFGEHPPSDQMYHCTYKYPLDAGYNTPYFVYDPRPDPTQIPTKTPIKIPTQEPIYTHSTPTRTPFYHFDYDRDGFEFDFTWIWITAGVFGSFGVIGIVVALCYCTQRRRRMNLLNDIPEITSLENEFIPPTDRAQNLGVVYV